MPVTRVGLYIHKHTHLRKKKKKEEKKERKKSLGFMPRVSRTDVKGVAAELRFKQYGRRTVTWSNDESEHPLSGALASEAQHAGSRQRAEGVSRCTAPDRIVTAQHPNSTAIML